jgi:hypothetical protein
VNGHGPSRLLVQRHPRPMLFAQAALLSDAVK